MLTGFQQLLAACIANTVEDNDQPDDVQHDDAPQAELEIATDDNSDDTEPIDTPVPEHTESGEDDVPSVPEETPPTDDAQPTAADESAETHAEVAPVPADENTEAGENSTSDTSDTDDIPDTPEAPDNEVPNAASSDSTDAPDESLVDVDFDLEDDTTSEISDVQQQQEAEATVDDSPQVADSETTETQREKTDEVDQEDNIETEPEPEPPTLELGIVEEIYDFVEMFEQSTISGTEQASVSGTDCAGGVTKPAIFEHPTTTETAKIDYTVSLPDVDGQEHLCLHFSIGLRDGVVFDDAAREPGGVKFAIEIFDLQNNVDVEAAADRCFESVSRECQWAENGIDLTHYAGKEIVISFLTECNVPGNSNYAWALWGKPQLRKLKQTHLRKGRRDPEPELRCGLAILHFGDEKTEFIAFNLPTWTAVSELTDICLESSESEARPVKIALYTALPKLEIVNVGATTAIVAAGEDFEVQCTLRNVGTAPLGRSDDARISINGVKLRRGRPRQIVKELDPGEESSISWVARRFSHPMLTTVGVSLKCRTSAGEDRETAQGHIEIQPASPKLSAKVVKELYTYTAEDGSVVMGNKNLRIVFVRSTDATAKTDDETPIDNGFAYYLLFVAKGGNYQQVAACPALSEVTYLDAAQNRQTTRLAPTDYQLAGNSRGESIVRLSGAHIDTDGVKWHYEMQWTLAEDATRVQTESHLRTDGDRELLSFRGPMLYAGQGRNPEKKTAALFPGLEFLENDEHSSSTRDAAPPLNNRLVPHPYKITVPVMAVEMQKSVVGIIWNPLDAWDGENQMLSAVFASPNWHQYQKNHALGVFLPTIPEWVQENHTEASIPYPLISSRPLSIKAEIIVDGRASIIDAVKHWTDAYGTPESLPPPRSDVEEVLLSRHGFMHTTWDEDTGKSRHCVGWAAHNEPGFGTLLWYDYLATKDAPVKERVQQIAKNTVADGGIEGLAARGSCHILRWEFPFYVGNVDAALSHMEAEAQQRITTQESDGSWRWHPTNEKTARLGEAGESVLGTCADAALLLLKHARITGNPASREAGLKALDFMQKFSIPRGAQMWECPMYQPDVLAAAHAIGAYVEAYELTSAKAHLKQATYWAETSLPFLYHWHLPDRPGMHFASIPVFGTTFYTHPWFGVPVQWNGLVLAYYLQRLNQHAGDERWHQIAECITVSAMYQQWDTGELKGTYPDGFYGFCTEGKGPHLNPEDIMVNVYKLRGVDPGIKTAIAGDVHLSSGAKIDAVTQTDSGQLNWQLSYAEGEVSYTLIVGYGNSPQKLQARYEFALPPEEPILSDAAETPAEDASSDAVKKYAETEIPAVETLENVESGWTYIQDKDAVVVKYLHPTPDVQFELSR